MDPFIPFRLRLGYCTTWEGFYSNRLPFSFLLLLRFLFVLLARAACI